MTEEFDSRPVGYEGPLTSEQYAKEKAIFLEASTALLRVYDSPDWKTVETYVQQQLEGTVVELRKFHDLPKTQELRGFINGLQWVLDHNKVVRITLKQLATSQEPDNDGETNE